MKSWMQACQFLSVSESLFPIRIILELALIFCPFRLPVTLAAKSTGTWIRSEQRCRFDATNPAFYIMLVVPTWTIFSSPCPHRNTAVSRGTCKHRPPRKPRIAQIVGIGVSVYTTGVAPGTADPSSKNKVHMHLSSSRN